MLTLVITRPRTGESGHPEILSVTFRGFISLNVLSFTSYFRD